MGMKKIIWKFISFFGSIYPFIIFNLIVLIFNKDSALKLFILLVLSLVVAALIRLVYFKQRPDRSRTNNIWLRIYNSSFPSVHAMRAVILSYFLSQINIFLSIFWILGFLVCYSRIYLKKHYFSDVVVGAIIGLILCMIIL